MTFGGKMLEGKYRFRAEFFDVDSMGVVWHGNYVKFAEMARCRLLDSIGYNYIKMRENGFALPVVKMDFKFIKPILFNDDVEVEITLQECDVLLKFAYRILSLKGEVLCLAHTAQVAVTLDGETMYAVPKDLETALCKR